MRIETCLVALGTALLAASAVPADETPRAPAAREEKADVAPARGYDEIFGEILQNLPEKSRAKVDSARAKAEGPAAAPAGPAAGNLPDPERKGSREKALEKLAPEVKARVEKAIRDLETKRRERALEFKELEK